MEKQRFSVCIMAKSVTAFQHIILIITLLNEKLLASGDRDHILSGVFNQFLSEKSEPAE